MPKNWSIRSLAVSVADSSGRMWIRTPPGVISLPEENVIQHFGIGDSGQVVYANNNNQIILAR